MLDWLRPYDAGKSLPALLEDARGSAFEPLVDELAADTLKLDDNWDWNAELEGAAKQLRDDWRRRRMQQLGARPLDALTADERSELAELARS
jgi:DNA primase